MSILTVTVELAPQGQGAVVMKPQTATTFGPMLTVGLGLLVSSLLVAQPVSRPPRVLQPLGQTKADEPVPPHATLFLFGL